jgi:hypothetical protein
MEFKHTDDELAEVKELLRLKHLKLSNRRIDKHLELIGNPHKIFPNENQWALLIQLLHIYDTTKKKEVIVLEEHGGPDHPASFVLGVLAEDWPGMSNSILGIIHHKKRNVLFMKGFTLDFEGKTLGIVILTFQLQSEDEYDSFLLERQQVIREIKDAARGSTGKYRLLDDEAVKFEIYNKIIKKIRELYHNSELLKIIEESGEVLKFVSSRSREYLEERNIKDLAKLVLNNYIYQNMIRSGTSEEIVKIKNLETRKESLTGITFVCKEDHFSIEDFLKTLYHIVPDHIIKHHKSYVTREGILVYRVEILDRNEKPLDAKLVKAVESDLEKMIGIACSKKFTTMKSVGGFEHYARAIIPFLRDEVKKTGLTQVFINIDRKTEFLINIKLIIVSAISRKKRVYMLISRLSTIPGIDISSSIPTKVHGNKIEINILKLKVNLSEFSSIKEIYNSIKEVVTRIYGDIRDFDEGFREIYIRILNQLLEQLKSVDAALIREVFFNVDELYKLEMSPNVLLELIRTCADAVETSKETDPEKILVKYKHMPESHRTILVISYINHKRLLSKVIQKLNDVSVYFTNFEWAQRAYLIMILSKDNKELDDEKVELVKDTIRAIGKEGIREC